MQKIYNLFFIMLAAFQLLFGFQYALAQGAAVESKIIPPCALDNPTGNPVDERECRNVSIYIILLLNVVNYLFGIVGALALLFFIYGGFTMIISRGNSEQTKKGIEIISAAVIGLLVVFGAYMLVRFLGTTIGLKSSYGLKGN